MIALKRSLKLWQIIGFVFTGIGGVLLHFLYDWTGESVAVAPFSVVNESIWEHMKLLFFPMFVFSLIEYKFIGKDFENYWCAKLIGILTGLIIIPMVFYTYSGVLGATADWFNIAIFFIAAVAAYYLEYLLMKNQFGSCKSPLFAFVLLCLIALLFVVMTFIQPKIPLFRDMMTGEYGI